MLLLCQILLGKQGDGSEKAPLRRRLVLVWVVSEMIPQLMYLYRERLRYFMLPDTD